MYCRYSLLLKVVRYLLLTLHKKLKTADLVIFTEEILNGKLHFLCSVTGIHEIGY